MGIPLSREQELNLQPVDYKSTALPIELSRHICACSENLFIQHQDLHLHLGSLQPIHIIPAFLLVILVIVAGMIGFEPTVFGLTGRCYIPLKLHPNLHLLFNKPIPLNIRTI